MNISSKRAEYVALVALGLSLIFFVISMLIGAFSGASAAYSLGWQILGGALVWFVLVIQLHQQSLAEREKLDKALLDKSRDSDTIFQSDANRMAMFESAQKQLAVLEKWFVPIFGVIIAVYQIALGLFIFFGLQKSETPGLIKDLHAPQLYAVFLVIMAFVAFLISRYATGMSCEKQWKPLRAGGSCLLSFAVLAFGLAISLALAQFKVLGVLTFVSWAIPIVLIVLGIETALNSVFDIYRPRIKGEYSRSAFDSRLLGAISEPGGILHTFASAIDYQFGFQVSNTWFYQLLSKAILPLIMIGILALYSLSCVVVVAPDEEAVIEHLGSFNRIAKPGITFKLPYPFDIAYTYPTTQIQQVNIGFVESEEEKVEGKPLLWGEKHYDVEFPLLIASKGQSGYGRDEAGTVPVSLVVAAVPVQYKIKDLKKFMYNHVDAREMIETICYRELTKYASSATIETDEVDSGKESLLGAGRKAAGESLKISIQASADKAGLGVEIVFLGLQGVHPPPEVAAEYQQVIGAVQQKQALIMAAEAERNQKLTLLGGSVLQVSDLHILAEKYQKADESGDEEMVEALGIELDKALENAGGAIYKLIAEAKVYAFEKVALAEAKGTRFAGQVKAYRAAPELYKRILRLNMLEESLGNTRKYVIVSDDDQRQVFIIDLEEKLAPSLYDLDLEVLK